MIGTLNHLGLASPDGSGATSSHGRGAVVRSRLAGAAVGIAVAAMTALGAAPAWAEHNPGHDVVARAQAATLAGRVDDLEDKVLLQHGVKTVFLTSAAYNADLKTAGGGLNGLQGADNICNAHALEGIVPPGHYVAWLSTFFKNAKDRLPANEEGYVLADGVTVVATSKADLLDGNLMNAITLTEFGTIPPVGVDFVWTGTAGNGSFSGDFDCDAWTDGRFLGDDDTNNFGNIIGRANPTVTDSSWTENAGLGTNAVCGATLPFYCFER